MINYSRFAGVALGAALASTGFSQIALTAGNTVPTPISAGDFRTGWTGIASVTQSFVGVNAQSAVEFTGRLESDVFENNTTGDLAFAYIVWNDPTSSDAITTLSVTHYAGYSTSVIQDPVGEVNAGYGLGVNSVLSSRTLSGDTLNFSFVPNLGFITPGSGEIDPGMLSTPQWVITNATSYAIGSSQISDGGIATVATYEPATPEPAPVAALGIGLIGLVRLRRRK